MSDDLGKRKFFDPDKANDDIRSVYRTYNAISGRDLVDENQFSAGELFQGVGADGGVADFLLRNPSGSGQYIFADTRAVTTALFYFNKEVNPTVNADGNASDIVQRRSDSTRTSVAEAYESPDVTEDGDAFNQKVVGSGTSGAEVTGGTGSLPEVMLAPGDVMYVKAVNQAGTTQDVSIDIDFTEVPETLIDGLDIDP